MSDRIDNVIPCPTGKVFEDTCGQPIQLAKHLKMREIFARCGVATHFVRTASQFNQAAAYCSEQDIEQNELLRAMFEFFATLFDPTSDPKSETMHEAFLKGVDDPQATADHIAKKMPMLAGRLRLVSRNETS